MTPEHGFEEGSSPAYDTSPEDQDGILEIVTKAKEDFKSLSKNECELFLSYVSELVISANEDPSRLTPEQHAEIAELQRLAGVIRTEMNLLLI